MVLVIPRVSFHYEEVGMEDVGMFPREGWRGLKILVVFPNIWKDVSHITFKEKSMIQEIETPGSYSLNSEWRRLF